MLNRETLVIALVVLLLLPVAAVQAQKRQACCPHYELDAEKTIAGVVESYDHPRSATGKHSVAVVEGKDGVRYELRLGPAGFAKKTGISLEKGDEVKVVCAPLKPDWKPGPTGLVQAVVRQIEVDGEQYELRNAEGRPLWSQAAKKAT
jgi:hypothetical protein